MDPERDYEILLSEDHLEKISNIPNPTLRECLRDFVVLHKSFEEGGDVGTFLGDLVRADLRTLMSYEGHQSGLIVDGISASHAQERDENARIPGGEPPPRNTPEDDSENEDGDGGGGLLGGLGD